MISKYEESLHLRRPDDPPCPHVLAREDAVEYLCGRRRGHTRNHYNPVARVSWRTGFEAVIFTPGSGDIRWADERR